MRARLILSLVLIVTGSSVLPVAAQDWGNPYGEWRYWGADQRSTRYSPLDQINADNFGDLEVAWIWRGDNFGPRPDFIQRNTPIYADGIVYLLAGTRRTLVAVDPATGETLWSFREPNTARWETSPRRNYGRGVAYGEIDGRGVLYMVTPAFFLHAGDAAHGDLGMIADKDVCILISYSGQSAELLDILKPINHIGADTIAITGKPDSALAKQCDFHLDIGVRSEADPMGLAPTSSSTATLVLGDALAIAVMETRGFNEEDFAVRHPGGVLGKKLLLTVDQIFHKGDKIPLIDKNTNIQEALLTISEKGLGFTGVIDDKGNLIGTITDGDIRRGVEKGNQNIFDMTAEDLMTDSPKKIPTDALAIKALEIMEEHSITSLFVHEKDDSDKLCGVIHIINMNYLNPS